MPQYVGGGTATSSFYHPTPSPADSGVMSPLTPGSTCGGGAVAAPATRHAPMTSPEQFSSSSSTSSGSPYFSHSSPADSGYACNAANASPFALTSPASIAGCGHHEANHYEHVGGGVGNGGSPLQPPCFSSAMGSATQMQGFWNSPHPLPRHHHPEGPFNVRKHKYESPSASAINRLSSRFPQSQ